MKAFVEIYVPGSGAARYALEVGCITIGKRGDSTIRLPDAATLSTDQLELKVSEAGVRVQVPSGTPGTFIFEGSEQRKVNASFGGEVYLGNARLSFVREAEGRTASPILLMLVPAVLIFAGLGVSRAGAGNAAAAQAEEPALFEKVEPAPCPERDPLAAERRARDNDRAAIAKQQRSSFELADGLDAVEYWRRAMACFQAAGKADEAARISRNLDDWTGRLTAHYATLRLQLKGDLEAGRSEDALHAVQDLESLLATREANSYKRWLGQLKASLEAKLTKSSD